MTKNNVTRLGLLYGLLLTVILFSLNGCNEEEEINPIPETVRQVNRFILDNMNTYYLWTDYIPQHIDPEHEPDSKKYFRKLLYTLEDRWSFITEDHEALVNSFSGIEKTFGHQLRLFLAEEESDQVVGIVEYVIPESPADEAGMQRGDIIYSINNTELDTANYISLLFTNESYTIGFGTIQDGKIVDAGHSVTLTAVTLQENPVHYYDIIEYEGHKIGYLVYNHFISDFEDELEIALQDLKDAGMTDLVLDLRYNPGGSVSTATKLGSIIAPSTHVNNQDVFVKYIWNSNLESYFIEKEGNDSPNLISKFKSVSSNLNLDLSRLYVIVSDNTASASEVVINCLNPYMEVIIIGNTTHGKYTGSITIQADEAEISNWAIQPIVLRVANSNDVTDYKQGFAPDYLVEDDLFSQLGSLEEDMFAMAVSVITGVPPDQLARKASPLPDLSSRKLISVTNKPVLDKNDLVLEITEID